VFSSGMPFYIPGLVSLLVTLVFVVVLARVVAKTTIVYEWERGVLIAVGASAKCSGQACIRRCCAGPTFSSSIFGRRS